MCPTISDPSAHQPVPPAHEGGRLTIDLGAIADNWRTLRDLAAPGACGAAVKANAYGLGLEPVSQTLWQAGCRHFFVALPEEAMALRAFLPTAEIFCLGGLTPDGVADYRQAGITPVLNTREEIAAWVESAPGVPAALHVDTGMNRLGLRVDEAADLSAAMPAGLELCYVMTHLACADEPDHPLNNEQIQAFERVKTLFPSTAHSFANSAGTLLAAPYTSDLSRPGIALYGGASAPMAANPIKPVITLEARVMQVRQVPAGEAVGYGATQTMTRGSRVAVLGVGYADGYHRLIGSSEEAGARFAGTFLPLVGRVSMDLITIDITDLSAPLATGDFVSLIDDVFTVDDAARCAQTIGYEILTGLGARLKRIYRAG